MKIVGGSVLNIGIFTLFLRFHQFLILLFDFHKTRTYRQIIHAKLYFFQYCKNSTFNGGFRARIVIEHYIVTHLSLLCLDSCFFDMVLAHPAVYLAVNTVLLLTVVLVNSVLYVLTWRKIRAEAHSIQLSVGRSQLVAASHAAAKNCLLFVIAFVLQVRRGVVSA